MQKIFIIAKNIYYIVLSLPSSFMEYKKYVLCVAHV